MSMSLALRTSHETRRLLTDPAYHVSNDITVDKVSVYLVPQRHPQQHPRVSLGGVPRYSLVIGLVARQGSPKRVVRVVEAHQSMDRILQSARRSTTESEATCRLQMGVDDERQDLHVSVLHENETQVNDIPKRQHCISDTPIRIRPSYAGRGTRTATCRR